MRITSEHVLLGLIMADKLLNLNTNHLNDLREISEQCVYLLYADKI